MENIDDLLWFKDAVIYELHIKAFKDSDGDGIGDFKGLMKKLDYLTELGVTAIWLLPFYPSPLKDDGYDIADYYSINPAYGSIDDFKELLDAAHQRGLKVITELVINHTSDQHPWFQRARVSPVGSVERDYYVWSDTPSKYKDVRIIFQDFESSNWAWDEVAGQYYWHRFFSHQPDLNFDNPAVRNEIIKIVDYWANMGVDGFRLDAIPYLFERENTNGENLPETHEYLKELRKHLDENHPGKIFLAEANMWPEEAALYLGKGDECHMNFHFPLMPRMFMSIQMEDRYPITDIFYQTPAIPYNTQWAIFLRNHDELTLEMVTDEERDYMYKVYAKNPKARINLGIRHRLAPLMENNIRKIELMNLMLFSLNGTPVIYYGDEIGMGDNFYLGDRNGVRTPMQWTAGKNAGFSEANPQQLYLPVILDPDYKYESVNVENQQANPSSLLWFMKRVIQFRKKYKALSRGTMSFINVENPKILSYIRAYEEETILVVMNLSRFAQPAELQLQDFGGYHTVEAISNIAFPDIPQNGHYFLSLTPYAAYFFVLKPALQPEVKLKDLPVLKAENLQGLITGKNISLLENEVIAPYFLRSLWFIRKGRALRRLNVLKHALVEHRGKEFLLLLIELRFETGLPNMFFLPLANHTLHTDETLKNQYSESLIAHIEKSNSSERLYDALYDPEFHQMLLENIISGTPVSKNNGNIRFVGDKKFIKEDLQYAERSRLLNTGNHVSIAFDTKYFLKIFRHVDVDTNSDVELNTYLSAAGFQQIPGFYGNIQWESGKGVFTLGMLQELIEYHGDGYTYMLERLNNFYERISARKKHPVAEYNEKFLSRVNEHFLPEDVREFLGATVADGIAMIGKATAGMHLRLASAKNQPDFQPEPFSLHYQRSLYSGFLSLLRYANNRLRKKLPELSEDAAIIANELLIEEVEILEKLKRIYDHKIDVIKTRIHGNLDLKQILITGKDVAIINFEGDPTKSYSERRFKRSPLRDVAGIIRSIFYAGFEGLVFKFGRNNEEKEWLSEYARIWIQHVSGVFLHNYYHEVKDSKIIPPSEKEMDVLMRCFLIEKALSGLISKLNVEPEKAIIPLSLLRELYKNE